MHRGARMLAVLAGAAMLSAAAAQADDRRPLPAPYDAHAGHDIAALVFGVLAGQRDARLTDARLWDSGGAAYLVVVAEAARPLVDGAVCDCARPVRLAIIERSAGGLHIVAAALAPDLRDGVTLSVTSALLDSRLGENGVFRLRDGELLLPVVRSRDSGARPRARLSLYRLRGRTLHPVFGREILDDPTPGDPSLSGMRARLRMGDLDPGGLDGFADIRFTETYFTRFAGDIVALDDKRIEIWVFGGDRYSLVQCEQTGPMGYGPCVQ